MGLKTQWRVACPFEGPPPCREKLGCLPMAKPVALESLLGLPPRGFKVRACRSSERVRVVRGVGVNCVGLSHENLGSHEKRAPRFAAGAGFRLETDGYLVDPASSHMLVLKAKPCMSKFKQFKRETANGSLIQS